MKFDDKVLDFILNTLNLSLDKIGVKFKRFNNKDWQWYTLSLCNITKVQVSDKKGNNPKYIDSETIYKAIPLAHSESLIQYAFQYFANAMEDYAVSYNDALAHTAELEEEQRIIRETEDMLVEYEQDKYADADF